MPGDHESPAAEPEPGGRDGAVVLAYVHDGRDVAYSWHHSLVEMIGHDISHESRVTRGGYIAYRCSTGDLPGARNEVTRLFLAQDRADWLFWVDTDMGFPPDVLDRLYAAADASARPFVGALAFTQREEQPDGMGGQRCLATPTVFDWASLDDGRMGFTVRWNYPRDELVRVAGTGSACVLIHRSVFERVAAEYGEHWYDRIPNTATSQIVSEDLSLCMRAGALGIPLAVHTGIKTTHCKTVWLGEDDYFGQVALSQMTPEVPAAAEDVAVIIPVLWRPGKAAPFMDAFRRSGAPTARVYAVADPEDAETAQAWRDAGAAVLDAPDGIYPGTWQQKANAGYEQTSEPWLFLAGDDCKFHPGWLDQAVHAARDGASVIGTNDMHNPRVTAGQHAVNWLIRRSYVDEQGASWDGPKVLAHEGYRHWYADDEIVAAAKQRGAWAFAPHSRVEHLNPLFGLSERDRTFEHGQRHVEQDRQLYEQRAAQYGAA